MKIIYLLLLIAAFACFVLAAIKRRETTGRSVDLIAAGLACWVLVPLLQTLTTLNIED